MTSSRFLESARATGLRRVLILADESADWKVGGLGQLDRILLTLQEFARLNQSGAQIQVGVLWKTNGRKGDYTTERSDLTSIELLEACDFLETDPEPDLVLSTRLFLFRDSLPFFIASFPDLTEVNATRGDAWLELSRAFEIALVSHATSRSDGRWEYLKTRNDISPCERRFLKDNGKSQDGLASRYVNRLFSRSITSWLLKTAITPSAWSLLIFMLPICGSFAFLSGTYISFIAGCAIFQLYSVLDGCDGEIARAKFLQSESGRRLDSLCDLAGNLLLALALGFGLSRHSQTTAGGSWFYFAEGICAAAFIVLSEGIVFVRRSRSEALISAATKWNAALYQRHHEFFERSGILFVGENFAWWLVQLTKRDMAMLAFLLLALLGCPQWNLHLLFAVGAVSSALAARAFLRQPAPAVAQEAG